MSEQQAAAAGATEQPSKKRKLTKEELAAISRANGAKSRGATSAAGAARARRGNYKHGLACEILPMETEDGSAIAQTVLDWYGYYRPASPLARTLTKICARSDIMLDRCYTFLDTTTDGQGREVIQAWEEARTTLVADLVALLPTSPDEAIGKLKAFGHGCRWLLDEWTRYQDELLRYGYWPLEVWPDVVRLFGADPDLDQIGASEPAFLAALYNFQCQPEPAVAQIAALCAPHRRPGTLAQLRLPAALPAAEESRRRLRALVATEVEEVRRLEQALRLGKDRADLERVLKQTLVLNDDAPSRQFLRYHKEWCAQFFRASRALPLALQRDASGFFDELAASDDDEPSQPLSPRERVPEGRVRADIASSAEASEVPEGQAIAAADLGHAPAPEEAAPATPAAEAVEHGEPVAEELPHGDSLGGALPASAAPAVAEAGGVTDRVGFPDPPSSMPVMVTQAIGNRKVTPRERGADGAGSPGHPVPSAQEVRPPEHQAAGVIRPSPAPRGDPAGVPSSPDGYLDPRGHPDRGPPANRAAPQPGEGHPPRGP
jgi:hypothetical protein